MKSQEYRIDKSKKVRLDRYPTRPPEEADKETYTGEAFTERLDELREWQERLYAENKYGLVIVLQARDAAGKDSLIKKVFAHLNIQGVRVANFKQPTSEETDHDYLWRINKALPGRGEIAIFNRSHYEDVLVTRVHDLLKTGTFPKELIESDIWEERYRQINDWERYLTENGIFVLKFFLHVSRETQAERLVERIRRPEKNWKFSYADISERRLWDEYSDIYGDMLGATSTEAAPWYVVPADKKWYTRYVVLDIVTDFMRRLSPQYPAPTGKEKEELMRWQRYLAQEKDINLADLWM